MRLKVHPMIVQHFNLAIQAIAPRIDKASTPLLHPLFDLIIHVGTPVFGMNFAKHDFIGIKVNFIVVKLMLAVKVVVIALTLQPRQKPPLGRGKVTELATRERISGFGILWHMVKGFWTLTGNWRVLRIHYPPFGFAT